MWKKSSIFFWLKKKKKKKKSIVGSSYILCWVIVEWKCWGVWFDGTMGGGGVYNVNKLGYVIESPPVLYLISLSDIDGGVPIKFFKNFYSWSKRSKFLWARLRSNVSRIWMYLDSIQYEYIFKICFMFTLCQIQYNKTLDPNFVEFSNLVELSKYWF